MNYDYQKFPWEVNIDPYLKQLKVNFEQDVAIAFCSVLSCE